jgi:hypothetical protein
MGKNKPKTFDGSKYSVWPVVDLANSYYELSAAFTLNLPETLDGLTEQRFLGIASLTNRILALELYFKALLVGQRGPVPQDHDLVVLFDALPEFIRRDIERMFNERVQASPKDQPWALGYFFGLGSMPDSAAREKAERQAAQSDFSLASLLERSRKLFVSSRYLFEYAHRDKVSFFNYEHRRLAILCDVLCEGLEFSMRGQNPGYKRRFQFEGRQPAFTRPDYAGITKVTYRPLGTPNMGYSHRPIPSSVDEVHDA